MCKKKDNVLNYYFNNIYIDQFATLAFIVICTLTIYRVSKKKFTWCPKKLVRMPRTSQEWTGDISNIKSPAVYMNKLGHNFRLKFQSIIPSSNSTAFTIGN